MEAPFVGAAREPGLDGSIRGDARNLIPLADGVHGVDGIRSMEDDHEIDIILKDQFGGRIGRLGRVTLRVDHP